MNINFNLFIKKYYPFLLTIFLAYFLSSILFLFLPKTGVSYISSDYLHLKYEKYSYENTFGLKKLEQKNEGKIDPRNSYQNLDNFILKGLYSTSKIDGWIVLEDKNTKMTHILSLKENIQGYTLNKIFENFAIFTKNNKNYKLQIFHKKLDLGYFADIKSSGLDKISIDENSVQIPRTYLNTYIKNTNKIWHNIAIAAIKKNGKINGFKIYNIRKGSVFEKIGLKRGDIIKAVNNRELKSYNDAFSVYKEINSLSYVTLKIIRKGEEKEINYEIN